MSAKKKDYHRTKSAAGRRVWRMKDSLLSSRFSRNVRTSLYTHDCYFNDFLSMQWFSDHPVALTHSKSMASTEQLSGHSVFPLEHIPSFECMEEIVFSLILMLVYRGVWVKTFKSLIREYFMFLVHREYKW